MALGQIQDRKKIAFEGDYILVNFEKHEAKEDFPAWGSYRIRSVTDDQGQSVELELSGWADSGCGDLELYKPYHFYFEYSKYFNKKSMSYDVKVRVIGCNPNLINDVKIINKPIEMEL